MSSIKDFVLSICFCAVAISIIDMLIPSGKMRIAMKAVTGSVFLLTVLIPLTNGIAIDTSVINIEHEMLLNNNSLHGAMLEKMKTNAVGNLEEDIKKVLISCDVTAIKIIINTDITEDNRICFNKAEVFIDEKDIGKAAVIQNKIEQELGLDAAVLELEEDG